MNTWQDLLNVLHEGGTKAYFWTRDWKWDNHQAHSEWFDVVEANEYAHSRENAFYACSEGFNGEPHNTYFPVHPLREIPPEATAAGSELFPWHVRGRIEQVQLGNCLFAEFDTKDYGTLGKTATHIRGLKFSPSIIVLSGGGYHCYWLLNAPATPDRLKAIQYGWVGVVGGDNGAKDLARILRVPGTLNLKYDPPRPVEIKVWSPGTRYSLDDLAGQIPPPPPPPPIRLVAPHIDQDLGVYLAKVMREEIEYVAYAPPGQRNINLNTAAYLLGSFVGGGLLDRAEVEAALTNAAMRAGLHEDPGCGMSGIAKTINSGLQRGLSQPRTAPSGEFSHPGRDIIGQMLTAQQGGQYL